MRRTRLRKRFLWRAKTLPEGLAEDNRLGPGCSRALYTYKTLATVFAGGYETFDKLGEEDGNDIIGATSAPATMRRLYYVQFNLCHDLAALAMSKINFVAPDKDEPGYFRRQRKALEFRKKKIQNLH